MKIISLEGSTMKVKNIRTLILWIALILIVVPQQDLFQQDLKERKVIKIFDVPENQEIGWLSLAPEGYGFVISVKGDKQKVIINGNTYEAGVGSGYIKFSKQRGRVAFISKMENGKMRVVIDNKYEALEYDEISRVVFSPDDTRYAYIGYKIDKGYSLVLDGVEKLTMEKMMPWLSFSPDGKKYTYAGFTEGSWWIFINDSKIQKCWSAPLYFDFVDPDKNSIVYAGVDKIGEDPDVKCMVYIPEDYAKHLNCSAKLGPYEYVAGLKVSSDRKKIGFCTIEANTMKVYINGKEIWSTKVNLDPFYRLFYLYKDALIFSGDGSRWALLIIEKDGMKLVIDGKVSQQYKKLSHVVFDKDTNKARFLASDSKHIWLLEEP